MADIIGTTSESVKGWLPDITVYGALNIGLWIIFVILVIVGIVILTWFLARNWKFNKKIIIWEKVDGRWKVNARDRATELRIKNSGDTCFYFLKRKKYVPRGVIQTGAKIYWYAIREDGQYVNIGMSDIDFTMREAGVKYLDKEVAYARTALQKTFEKRYEGDSWLAKNWPILFGSGIVIILVVFLWLGIRDYAKVAETGKIVLESAVRVNEASEKILSALNNICSGGSGFKPA